MDLIRYILEVEARAVVIAGRIVSDHFKNYPSNEARLFLETLNEQTSSHFTIGKEDIEKVEEPDFDDEIYDLQYLGV